jgi:hypothetical protein
MPGSDARPIGGARPTRADRIGLSRRSLFAEVWLFQGSTASDTDGSATANGPARSGTSDHCRSERPQYQQNPQYQQKKASPRHRDRAYWAQSGPTGAAQSKARPNPVRSKEFGRFSATAFAAELRSPVDGVAAPARVAASGMIMTAPKRLPGPEAASDTRNVLTCSGDLGHGISALVCVRGRRGSKWPGNASTRAIPRSKCSRRWVIASLAGQRRGERHARQRRLAERATGGLGWPRAMPG